MNYLWEIALRKSIFTATFRGYFRNHRGLVDTKITNKYFLVWASIHFHSFINKYIVKLALIIAQSALNI